MRTINCSLTVGSPRDRGCRAGRFTRSITSKRFILFAAAVLAIAVMPTSAFAQNDACLADVSAAKSCSANDVSLASVDGNSVNVFSGGIKGTNKCFATQTFSFIANFTIHTTSNARRSNIGIYFGTGQSNALHGSCSDSIIAPLHPCAGDHTLTCGDAAYEEIDTNGEPACTLNGVPSPCGCGDTTSADGNGTGNQMATLEVDGATCPASGNLTLNYCTSWFQPTANTPQCLSPAPYYPWEVAATAGTPAKCNCTTIVIPVQPISPQISVTKSCTVGSTTSTTSCNAGAEGSTVVYTATINNTTTSSGGGGGVIPDQICDDQYGKIFRLNTFSGAQCAAGALCTGANNVAGGSCINSTTCSSSNPGDIPAGSSGSCTFTVTQGEIATVKDTVTAIGHSDVVSTVSTGNVNSNQVTVTSTDNPTTATTSLASAGPQAACVTQRYTVNVANTSLTDESVTLTQVGTSGTAGYVSALQDGRYGDITQTHGLASTDGSVTGTTCGVAAGSPGLGSLSLTTAQYISSDCVGGNALGTLANCNGGAFNVPLTYGTGTAPSSTGGFYQCQFDGVVCGNLSSTAVTNCSAGITKTDTGVTANLTLDNGEVAGTGISFNETINPFTTNICVSTQP